MAQNASTEEGAESLARALDDHTTADMDVRNLNRCWPGKPDGLLVERTTYALSELIRKEKVGLAVDFH